MYMYTYIGLTRAVRNYFKLVSAEGLNWIHGVISVQDPEDACRLASFNISVHIHICMCV